MKKIFLGIVLMLFMQSCSTSNLLLGKWYLEDKTQVNYPTATFDVENFAIFTSQSDTIYTYKFTKKGKYLHLATAKNEITKHKILRLTKDKLVFESLLMNKRPQVYTRKK